MNQAVLLFPLLTFHAFSRPEDSVAPMEKTEQEALYLAVQSLAGIWCNGSELYPDPCSWMPLQFLVMDRFPDLVVKFLFHSLQFNATRIHFKHLLLGMPSSSS